MDSNRASQELLKRIFIWTNPRSLGTALLKCMSQVPDVKITNGLLTSCFFHGPEAKFPKGVQEFEEGHSLDSHGGIESEFTGVYDASKVSYDWGKVQLQANYPEMKYMISKETAAFAICEKFDRIPAGFCHTFLIRHPYRMWSSWKKNFSSFYPDCDLKIAIQRYHNNYFTYKELYDLMEYLRNNPNLAVSGTETSASQSSQSVKFTPVILDADDLQNHPESILPQYCEAIGVPYTDDMLHWDAGIDLLKDWRLSMQLLGGGLQHGDWGFYQTAVESTHFFPSKRLPEKDELDADVLEVAEMCLPYYEKMYNMRTIRP